MILLATMLVAAARNPSGGPPQITIPFAIIAEATLVAFLCRYSMRSTRCLVAWLVVTSLTWLAMIGGLLGFDLSAPKSPHPLALLAFEAVVVLVEAWILRRLSGLAFLQVREGPPLPYSRTLGVSLVANLLSFLLPLLL